MHCEDARTHLPDHLTGTLSAPAAAALDEHLRACAACAAEREALEDTWRRLRAVPAQTPDSAAMRARFDAAVADYPQPARRLGMPYGLQFAAAAALLLLGIGIGRQTAPPPAADPQIAELRDEVRDMREMVTLSLLQQQSASERLRGVTWTNQIEQPGDAVTAALLDTLMHDPNVNVRLATVDALKRFAEHDAVRRGTLEALPRQSSPLVQIALIDFIVDVNNREAAATLRELARDPMVHEAVRARATEVLDQMG